MRMYLYPLMFMSTHQIYPNLAADFVGDVHYLELLEYIFWRWTGLALWHWSQDLM